MDLLHLAGRMLRSHETDHPVSLPYINSLARNELPVLLHNSKTVDQKRT
jgi:hypothetical protein